MLDALLQFSSQQALAASGNSTNVFDTVTAKKLFGGELREAILAIQVTAAGGVDTTFQAQLIGASTADLLTAPVVLADTGVSAAIDGVNVVLPLLFELRPQFQQVAKEFYGIKYTLGGATHTATVNAHIANVAQSWLANMAAAVPAQV